MYNGLSATAATSVREALSLELKTWEIPMGSEWECMECGYLHEGGKPPHRCPDCGAVGAWELVEYVDDLDDESEDEEDGIDELDEE